MELMSAMTGPSPGLRRRRRSITPRATDEASIPRSIWPGSPASCKPTATTASSRCSTRGRRRCRSRRRFASPMRGGASSSWLTSRKRLGTARRASRSLRSRWRRSRRLDALFEIERAINGRSADERRAVRQEKSKPLLEDMHAWLLRERETLSRSAEVLKPINYMLKRWSDFARFLDDGRICLSNNCAERCIARRRLGKAQLDLRRLASAAPTVPPSC